MKAEKGVVSSLGLSGIRINNIQETESSLEVWVEKDTPVGICPACGVMSDKVNDTRYHQVIDRPMFNQVTTIQVKKQRFKCLNEDCGIKTFTEVIEGLKPKSFYTDLFRDFVYSRLFFKNYPTSSAPTWSCSPIITVYPYTINIIPIDYFKELRDH